MGTESILNSASDKAMFVLAALWQLRIFPNRPPGLPLPCGFNAVKEFDRHVAMLRNQSKAFFQARLKAIPLLEAARPKLPDRELKKAFGRSALFAIDLVHGIVTELLKAFDSQKTTPETLDVWNDWLKRLIPNFDELNQVILMIHGEFIDAEAVLTDESRKKGAGAKTIKSTSSAVFDEAKGIVVVNGVSIVLESSEKYVLQILVQRGAAKFSELQRACDRPDRALKALLKKHLALRGYITLPGGPGRGGYSTKIKPKKKPVRSCQK